MANWDRLKRDALFEMLKFKKRISLKIFLFAALLCFLCDTAIRDTQLAEC